MTQRSSSYDYNRITKAAKSDSNYESFSTYIDAKIKRYRYETGEHFSRIDLAKQIGISYEMLKKVINGSKNTRKRDFIIAICIALEMDCSETNLALSLYPMAPLNPHNMRDLVIIQAIADHKDLVTLNRILMDLHFPKLNINSRANHSASDRDFYYPKASANYEECECRITPYRIAGTDDEISLCSRYLPINFDFDAYMILKDHQNHKIRINAYAMYPISDQAENGDFVCRYNIKRIDDCTDPELLLYNKELNYRIDRKAGSIMREANDTRNYIMRISAEVIKNKLVMFGETFNYQNPELNEYYQFEVQEGTWKFTISNNSLFMQRYLPKDQYKKLYGIPVKKIIAEYTITSNERCFDKFPEFQQYVPVYKKLKNAAYDLLDKLQTRELFIFNARAFIDIDELIKTFHVEQEQELDCTTDYNEPYEFVPQKDSFIASDGTKITIEDLYRAYEFDITSISDICQARKIYGSLENILQL